MYESGEERGLEWCKRLKRRRRVIGKNKYIYFVYNYNVTLL